MKTKTFRRKVLFPALILMLVLTLGFVAACENETTPPEPDPTEATLVALTVSGQKTSFEYGEDFSTGNIVVTAEMSDDTQKQLGAGEYTVDSSEYNRLVSDTYKIYVRASDANVATSYSVVVGDREILPAPTVENAVYAYNNLDDEFNNAILDYDWSNDDEWADRYSISVFAPGDEENAQEVGTVAAYSQLFGSVEGLSTIGSFDFNGTVVVRITTDFYFEEVDIRPSSLGIEYHRVEDIPNTIEFTLTRPCNISIEFDQDTCKNIMLFSDYLQGYSAPSSEFLSAVRESVSAETDNLIEVTAGDVNVNDIYAQYSDTKHNVIVFGAGLYYMKNGENGGRGQAEFQIPSNSTVYIHGDAAIYGFLRVIDANNVTIKGRGYVSGQKMGQTRVLYVEGSKNVLVEGITLYHSINWTNVLSESQDITYRSVRIAGQCRNNNDGFDICGSSDVLVDNCWIRTIDDGITIKGRGGDTRTHIENIVVQNTVLWNYQGGNALVVGSESCTDVYNNIVFSNIDVIHNTTNRAIAMEIIDSATVSNIVFENIRMELDNDFSFEYAYSYGSDYGNTSALVMLRLMSNEEAFYGTDTNPGKIENVTFNNISYTGNPNRKIEIVGIDDEHKISGIAFNNFSYNGTLLSSGNISSYLASECEYYEGLVFDGTQLNDGKAVTRYDDSEFAYASDEGVRQIQISDDSMVGGGYSLYSVRLTDSLMLDFDIAADGYFMPNICYIAGSTGGLFDVKLDNSYVGTINTYSAEQEYRHYSLPLCFMTQGKHTVSFTARSIPFEKFNSNTIDFSFDGMELTAQGTNFIEFETLSSSATRVADAKAGGGYAVDVSADVGESVVFSGNNENARGAQLLLTYLAGPDKGIYKFYFGDDLVSVDIDMYSAVEEYRTAVLDTVSLPDGAYTITAACVGQNETSTGTGCRLDCIKTVHLAVSKTYKGGYEGVYNNFSVSSGVTIERGMFQPIRLSNIQNGATITSSSDMAVQIDGVYEHRISVTGYDPSVFDIYLNNSKIETEFQDNTIIFRTARRLDDTFILQFVCTGSGTYAFDFNKVEIIPVDVDKTQLRSLVNSEDARIIEDDVAEYLKENYIIAFNAAKEVLFDRTGNSDRVANAIEALQVAASRLEDGKAPYNEATLTNTEIQVYFDDARVGDLAVLYLNSGADSVCYYAIVTDDGSATFTVEGKYAEADVKLYCEVIGNPLAGAEIQVGDKVVSALDFIFDDDYWLSEETEAFYFETLAEAESLIIQFDEDTVQEGELVMLSLRNALNEDTGEYFAFIGQGGIATIQLDELPATSHIYAIAVVSLNENAVVRSITAEDVLLGEANGGKLIAGTETSDKVTVTTTLTADENGAIHYPAKGGYRETQVRIAFSEEFETVTFDLTISAYCGSGGSDTVGIYMLSDTNRQIDSMSVSTTGGATGVSTKTETFTFTYDECGGGVLLKIWIGCAGDRKQCQADPPHGDELLTIGNIRFNGEVSGQLEQFRLLNGNDVAIPANVVETSYFENLENAASISVTFASDAVQSADSVSLILYDEDGKQLSKIDSTVEESGSAKFLLTDLSQRQDVYAVVENSAGVPIAVDAVCANLSVAASMGALVNGVETSDKITVTTAQTVDSNGAIHYSVKGGYRETQVRIAFSEEFETVTFDLTISAYCGSGGADNVGIYMLSDTNKQIDSMSVSTTGGATGVSTKTETFTFSYDECGGGVLLKIWVGCAGDWKQCKADPPHGDELLTLGTVTITGESAGVKMPLLIGSSESGT